MPPQDHSNFAVQTIGDKVTEPGALEIKWAEISSKRYGPSALPEIKPSSSDGSNSLIAHCWRPVLTGFAYREDSNNANFLLGMW